MHNNYLTDMKSGSPLGRDEGLSMTRGVYENEPENSVSRRFSCK